MGSGAPSSTRKGQDLAGQLQPAAALAGSDRAAASAQHAAPPVQLRPQVEMTFLDTSGNARNQRFRQKPLGFEISLGVMPIRVDNVYGQGLAGKQGVEMGWYLTKVNGIEIGGKSFEEAFAIVKSAMAVLPAVEAHDVRPTLASLEIVFEAGDDRGLVPVVFSKKPLGFEFEMRSPISVKSIKEDCVAKRHGVEVGWVVKKVSGLDISEMAFADQMNILKRSVTALPDVTYCIAPPLSHSLSTGTAALPDRRDARQTYSGGESSRDPECPDDGRL